MIDRIVDYASELLGRDAGDLVCGESEASDPIAAPGGGFVHSDAPADDLARVLAALDAPDAEQLAAEAQAWQLPVLPYRSRQYSSSAAAPAARPRPDIARARWSSTSPQCGPVRWPPSSSPTPAHE